jgi:hypothetical protein
VRALSVAVALALGACIQPEPRIIPTSVDDRPARAAALLGVPSLDTAAGVSGAFVDLTQSTYLTGPLGANVLALYAAEATTLGWAATRLTHDPEFASRLRRPDALFQLDEAGAWVRAPEALVAAEALTALRFGPDDACADGRMCIDDAGYCTATCPEPSVVEPAPPVEWPGPRCPPGVGASTRTVVGARFSVCQAADVRCDGATRLVGDACVPLGRACATDAAGWPSPPPAASGGRQVWVKADAPAGGDGSRGRPRTIDEALLDLREDDVVILSSGRHTPSSFNPGAAVSVFGVCALQTELVLPAEASITTSVRLDALTLRGASGFGVDSSAELALTGVLLTHPEGTLGVRGRLLVEESAIEGVAIEAGLEGRGSVTIRRSELRAQVAAHGRVELEDVRIRDVPNAAVDVQPRGFIRIVDGVLSVAAERLGVFVRPGGRAELERVVVFGGGKAAELQAGAVLTGDDLTVDIGGDIGFQVLSATVALRAVAVRGPRSAALKAEGHARVELERWIVSSTPRALELKEGTADARGRPSLLASDLRAEGCAQVMKGELARLELRRLHLGAVGESTTTGPVLEIRPLPVGGVVDVSDVRIDEARGAGVWLYQDPEGLPTGFEGRLERIHIESARGIGVAADGLRGDLTLTDLRIAASGTEGLVEPCTTTGGQCRGTAIFLGGGALSTHLERFVLREAAEAGLWVGPSNTLRARDGWVGLARMGMVFEAPGDWRDNLRYVRFTTSARP